MVPSDVRDQHLSLMKFVSFCSVKIIFEHLSSEKCSRPSSGACNTMYSWWNCIETSDSEFVLITWCKLIFFTESILAGAKVFLNFFARPSLEPVIFGFFLIELMLCCSRADVFFFLFVRVQCNSWQICWIAIMEIHIWRQIALHGEWRSSSNFCSYGGLAELAKYLLKPKQALLAAEGSENNNINLDGC